MDKEQIKNKLFNLAPEKCGEKQVEYLFDQYKIYIESAEKISDRRQKTNEFFLGINTALVALLGFILTQVNPGKTYYMFLLASIAGAIVCYYWYRIILSYKGLNGGKFKVIHLIEEKLPLALYDTEWEILERGENKKVYCPFTHIELKIPWIFITIYGILFLGSFPWVQIASLLKL
jgi:hypothetical protein